MTSFNDGIEAAAKYLRDRRDENKEVGNEFQALMCEAQAQAVEALKRPEPSEADPASGKVLWCVNVIGPDDVHAAPDFKTAWRWAEAANADLAPRADALNVMWRCTVAVWPWDCASHAEDLKRGGRNSDIDFPALAEAHVERVARAISETRRCPKENGQEVGGAWWWDTRHDGPENSFAHESREEDRRAARAALAAAGGE